MSWHAQKNMLPAHLNCGHGQLLILPIHELELDTKTFNTRFRSKRVQKIWNSVRNITVPFFSWICQRIMNEIVSNVYVVLPSIIWVAKFTSFMRLSFHLVNWRLLTTKSSKKWNSCHLSKTQSVCQINENILIWLQKNFVHKKHKQVLCNLHHG